MLNRQYTQWHIVQPRLISFQIVQITVEAFNHVLSVSWYCFQSADVVLFYFIFLMGDVVLFGEPFFWLNQFIYLTILEYHFSNCNVYGMSETVFVLYWFDLECLSICRMFFQSFLEIQITEYFPKTTATFPDWTLFFSLVVIFTIPHMIQWRDYCMHYNCCFGIDLLRMEFSYHLIPKHFLWFIQMSTDQEVSKHVETICLASSRLLPILLS